MIIHRMLLGMKANDNNMVCLQGFTIQIVQLEHNDTLSFQV